MQELSFSQRMGLAPLPSQLQLNEISNELRVRVWSSLFEFLSRNASKSAYGAFISGTCYILIRDVFVYYFNRPLDEVSAQLSVFAPDLKRQILDGTFSGGMDLIQYVVSHSFCPSKFVEDVAFHFANCKAAYRLDSITKLFYPVTSEVQALAVQKDLEKINSNAKYKGATEHLQKSAKELMAGRFDDSIRESIHAVESCVCLISGTNTTLSDGIKKLESAGVKINTAFKHGIEKLYGYTNGERGIRHSSLGLESPVDEADAVFMFGACAAFCSFLIEKNELTKNKI